MQVGGWIIVDNMGAFLNELERLSGAALDLGEYIALVEAIRETDGDAKPERWTEQVFEGQSRIVASFAIDQGADVLRVSLDAPDEIAREANVLMQVMTSYHMHPLNPPRRE